MSTGGAPQGRQLTAGVLTVSDRVSAGEADDRGGPAVAAVLADAGYDVRWQEVVPDDTERIAAAIDEAAATVDLVVTTGGTGFGPRDVTPEATRAVLHREAPGLAEAMRAAGRRSTPMADLSRGIAGVIGTAVVVNLPGSPRGAVESLEAIVGILGHAVRLAAGHPDHH